MDKESKLIWSAMTNETKRKAPKIIMKEFGLKSETAIKQNWLWGEKVPCSKTPKLKEIFKYLLKAQIEKSKYILKSVK